MIIKREITKTEIKEVEVACPYYTKREEYFYCMHGEGEWDAISVKTGKNWVDIGTELSATAIKYEPCTAEEFNTAWNAVWNKLNIIKTQIATSEIETNK